MGGEVFDAWVDLLPLTIVSWEEKDGKIIPHLGASNVNKETGKSGTPNVRARVLVSQMGLVVIEPLG